MPIQKGKFTRFSQAISRWAGNPLAFILASVGIVIWALSGPIFHFGDTWQLVINTTTTIITFLMVFLIQNTQNRDTAALQIKLDELIRVTAAASNSLLDMEELDERQIDEFHKKFEKLAARARHGKDPSTDEEASEEPSGDAPAPAQGKP